MKNHKLLLKVSVLTSILLLAGCGQKGPLFLEAEKGQETVNTPQGKSPDSPATDN